ncbi:MAG: peptidoglycan binding domain-containing protein, partial [Atopobiaceae bacterium]|nr:peptidoglycan binding domain-containing protein [Atopobiaceae bacterium]
MTNTTDQPTGTLGSDTSTSKSAPLSPTSLVGALKQKAAAGGKHNTTIIAAVAIALAVIYIAGTVFFSSHFVYGTTVNGIDASGLTTTELAKLVDDETSSFSTHVTGDGLDFTINATDIEMKADSQALAKDALESTSPFAWPATLISHPIITSKVGITYNRKPLAQAVSDAVGAYNEGATPPTNATATFDAETKTYKIVPMQLGTQVNGDAVTEAVENSIKTLSPTTTLNEKQLQEPDILEDNP